MRVTVRLHGYPEKGKEREESLPDDATAHTLLQQLDIPSEAVLVFRGGDPIPVDATLATGDELRVVRIVSGGAQ